MLLLCRVSPKQKKTERINSSFCSPHPHFSSQHTPIIHSGSTSSWKDTNCPFLGCFHFTEPRRLVKPTISSFKLYHHSHVLIKNKKERKKKKKASCLKMSRVEFDQFQRMCQESWKSLPRLTRVVRAATDYWTKLQLCVLFSLRRSHTTHFSSTLPLSHKILHYNTVSQWV